jgi:hypothetical protein
MMFEENSGRCESARCPATTDVTATEWERLAALPYPLDSVRPDLTCELAAGHPDGHIAFAVATHGGNQLWWLRWAERQRNVVQLELCPAEEADSMDDCLLPQRHRGPHSFDIQPVQGHGDNSARSLSSA